MRIDKFDFNDRFFDIAYVFYQEPFCPVVDGFYYNTGRLKNWLAVSNTLNAQRADLLKDMDDLESYIYELKDKYAEQGWDFHIYLKEAGKPWKCVAIIKPKDIKEEYDAFKQSTAE